MTSPPAPAAPPPRIWSCLLLPLLLLPACGTGAPEWTGPERTLLYGAALSELRNDAGGSDTLFVAERPRLLDEVGPDRFQAGEFNRYGDPSLSAAIAGERLVSACTPDPGGGCSGAAHRAYAAVSEVMPIGPREAVVLASTVVLDGPRVTTRHRFIQLRFRSGSWRVTRVGDGESVSTSSGVDGSGESEWN